MIAPASAGSWRRSAPPRRGRLSRVYAGTDDDEWGRLAQLREITARELG
ncbi:hypothetical protein ACFSDA_05730 [Brachybacterium rhamnosum]|uniref:Uncharacterized protein n=1 Tax=Brachybacterium rhamnosum TaxID=173361 RepID=A0ABW4PWQ2_9MICO